MPRLTGLFLGLACCVPAGALQAEEARPSEEGLAFFEKKIRPVLVAQCYKCHSATAKKLKAGLMLDTRAGMRKGGESGPAIVPGDVRASLLLRAIRNPDPTLRMPPSKKLPDEVIADFERWVRMGAPDPRGGKAVVVRKEIDIEKGRQFWSFRPPRKPTPPKVKAADWPRSDIDRFLLAAMEAKGLKPVADADKQTLIRRVTFDLIGLPPTPDEVEAFVKDDSPRALEKVVDRLLAMPYFGERWGRHWLDVARYAESSGKEVNFNYPHAWRYRDYVIDAFNKDLPYDQFIREQVAGDLLPAETEKERVRQQIATGFLAIGPKSHNERNRRQFEMDLADEQIDVTTQAFLGLTAACARCHDHKFDPIPQKDYYALAGIFRSTQTCYGTIRILQSNHPSPLLELPRDAVPTFFGDTLTKQGRERLEGQIDDLREQLDQMRRDNPRQRFSIQALLLRNRMTMIRSRLDSYNSDGSPKQFAMGVRERWRSFNSPLYTRGEIDKPGEIVPRGVLQVVGPAKRMSRRGSGRLELAEWLASKDNPLAARVMVNRVWLHLFGRGIVPTPDNFGAAGRPPENPALLDQLAVSFMEDGWSVKKLIRKIVLSHAYQLGSYHDEKNYAADPDNALVWRMSKRRLDAEALRDAMISVSGQFDTTPTVGSSVARAGEGRAFGPGAGFGPGRRFGRFGGFGAGPSLSVRSVYLPVIREQMPESLTLFDAADPSLIVAERSTTTTPAQALYLMNNPFVIQQAEAAADRLLAAEGSDRDRVRTAYLRFFARTPGEKEIDAALDYLEKASRTTGRTGPGDRTRRAAWASFCQALFASAEFLYLN
jgi:hypothetical protein